MAIEMRVVGLDVAKNVFQVHGVDHRGETVLRRRLRRSQVGEFFRQQTPCLIGIEATQWCSLLGSCAQSVGT
jgi:transposase